MTKYWIFFSYTEVGRYNITVSAYGLVEDSKLTINSIVEIMSPIQNLSVNITHDGKNTVVTETHYFIDKHRAGKPIYFKASVASGWPVIYNFTVKKAEASDKMTKMSLLLNGGDITPDVVGFWNVSIVARNVISKKSCAISIEVQSSCEPRVEIIHRRPKEKPLKINRSFDIRIKTQILWYNESCRSSETSCFHNWTLYYFNQSEKAALKQKQNLFFVKGGKLRPGIYQLNLVAVCNDTQIYCKSFDETFLHVEAIGPVAVTKGKSHGIGNAFRLDIVSY